MADIPPCSGSMCIWKLVPNTAMLAGYIRYIYLENFETWLKRDEWDKSEEIIIAEDLFGKAEKTDGLVFAEKKVAKYGM